MVGSLPSLANILCFEHSWLAIRIKTSHANDKNKKAKMCKKMV